ncbi:hypothetical protein ANME2D_00921 [Candidatus Methanoperedens nitroreducens]|uniref:Uncharacterized protein n=1 Tax=Candidatus Methanoperedens nitratireducens TaxID=1392998 RepID=A0A062V9V2_9EURY|nr:hypothetical protein [Candidatus Methanoperedens nitroreducens]KCZ72494.1 hypothetical protein ANME2D_00921 [Candidatus Methanoperedens nitroreducens]
MRTYISNARGTFTKCTVGALSRRLSRQSIAYPQLSRQLTPCTRMPDALAYVDASLRGAILVNQAVFLYPLTPML